MQQQEQIKAGEEIRPKKKEDFENLISIVASLIAQLILHSNCSVSFGW